MREGPPTVPIKTEQEPTFPSVEALHSYGNQYQQIIEFVVGKTEADSLEIDSFPPELKKYFEIAQEYKSEQEKQIQEKGIDARALLTQAFTKGEDEELIADESKYRLEKLSDGIYAVFMDPDLIQELRPGAAAIAYRGKGKVQFVLIKEFKEPEYQKKNLEENIPHEVHHLTWGAAQDREVFPNSETDPHFRASFRIYQDELVARASSGGGLGGYHHIGNLSAAQKEELEAEAPGHAETIIQRVSGLNRYLYELQYLLHQSTVLTSVDLLQPVITSTSFDELEQNLRHMENLVKEHPFKEEEKDNGWGITV